MIPTSFPATKFWKTYNHNIMPHPDETNFNGQPNIF